MAGFKAGGAATAITLFDPDRNKRFGSLLPVSERLARDPYVIGHLCRWRSMHRTAFLTVIEPTPETTISYLTDISLADPGRMLFMICDIEGSFIGCVGLKNIEAQSAELDNVLRGEPPPGSGFMRNACRTVLWFAFGTLLVSSVYLHVLHDNARAIALYHKLGFSEVSRVPLTREAIPGGYRLVRDSLGQMREQMLSRMEIEASAWHRGRAFDPRPGAGS